MTQTLIDWHQFQQQYGHAPEQGQRIMAQFMLSLPAHIATIDSYLLDGDNDAAQSEIHALHGACSYCCTPELKQQLQSLEQMLKLNETSSIPAIWQTIDALATLLIEEWKAHENSATSQGRS